MTEIAFHVNTSDKLAYACRLLRKAWTTGAQVVVTGEPDLLRELDVSLWTFAPLEFVPHCYGATATDRVQARTPIVLADTPRGAPHHQVLVNLGPGVPDGFERFERLIELVGAQEQDLQAGRQRWKHYASRGYALQRHEAR
ncbi:MAG TPA: DNA polymerase III subunit chi [Ramlibacter sp.]|jgi:DNA polymerase-3 subunit chi|uniref:DNA polymerase III subunit chi n=1 Tax=Ramlibacter sp. TaxID=1917967 RepID=UPI002D62E694|nr:DNA polymerase III subunit chi [Ramlibacter sp.]HZY19264.1 DNA polymerase III subunit chi [Ramlibacter sp.]